MKIIKLNSSFITYAILALVFICSREAKANCTTPTTVISAQAGNFNTGSTWVGGVVPTSCDYVIINHNVNLDVAFSIGQNGYGGLTINSGKTLSGSNTLTISAGYNYTLTNNGTLSISSLNMNSGSPAGRFVNNGTCTFSSFSGNLDANTLIINSGTLTFTGNVSLSGSGIQNREFATMTISGTLNLQGSPAATVDNAGTLNVNSNNATQAFNISSGTFTNSGTLNVPNGGFYMASGNATYNSKVMNVNYIEVHDAATLHNTDSILINNDLVNGAQFSNYPGAFLRIGRDLQQINKSASYLVVNGYVYIVRNFSNDKVIGGSGGVTIGGTSTNTSNGVITDSVSICDLTKSSPSLIVDVNSGTIGSNVKNCTFTPPTASLIPTIIGNRVVCASSTGNVYSVAAVSGATYKWSVPSGWTITAGVNTRSITVTAGSSGGIISATVTTGSGYGTSSVEVTTSGATPSTPGTIFGPTTTACAGTAGYTFTIQPVSGATTYTWSVPSGWTINSGQGTTSISTTVGGSSGNVSVTAGNICGTSSARTFAVTSNSTPNTPGAITGNSAACNGSGFTYSITAISGATNYQWTVPSGWNINFPGSGNTCATCTNTITGTYGNTSGNVTVTASNPCGTSGSNSMAVSISGSSPGCPTFSGNQSPCAGQNYTYTATISGATSYTWSVAGGYTIVSGQGTSSVVITAGAVGNNQNISCFGTNACGTGCTSTYFLSPIPVPTQPGTITGPASPCPNTSGLSYSCTAASGNGGTISSYTWVLPSGWTITSGSGTTSITVTSGSASGNVSVKAVNTNGCIGPERLLAVTPVTVANAGSTQTVCSSSVTLAGNNPTVGTGTWTKTSGTGSQTITSASTYNTTVTGMVSGAYVFRWKINGSSSCPNNYSEVTIRKDCNSNYTTTGAICPYANGNLLASFTDPDGTISSASLSSGSLPDGVSLNASNGNITVSNKNLLVYNTYSFGVTTTDQYGGSNAKTVNITLSCPLPVTLTSFSGKALSNNKIQLDWVTASELENNFFAIEKSRDGRNFIQLAKETGFGTSNIVHKYQYTDDVPFTGINYYRLKQVDYNGTFVYSNIIVVNTATQSGPTLLVYPNPTRGNTSLNLELGLNQSQMVHLCLCDATGKIFYQGDKQLNEGLNKESIQLSNLQPGIYFIRVTGLEMILTQKISVE